MLASLDTPSGQSVKDEIETYYESEINAGRLYPNLNGLVEDGYVEKGQLDRRTNYYAFTDEGLDRIEERREWEDQYFDR